MRSFILGLVILQLCGCASTNIHSVACYDKNIINSAQYFMNSNYAAVDNLIESMPLDNTIGMSQPLIVASIVGIDGLKSSRFGKTISEQMATRLTNKGYKIIELKLRNNVFIEQKAGEFMLSRELKDIMKNHNAQAALTGTYSESKGYVYVTAKIVSLTDGISVASTDYNLCIDSNISFMLSKPTDHEPTD